MFKTELSFFAPLLCFLFAGASACTLCRAGSYSDSAGKFTEVRVVFTYTIIVQYIKLTISATRDWSTIFALKGHGFFRDPNL